MNYGIGPKLGFVGLGFVGTAVATSYSSGFFQIIIKDPAKGYHASWKDLKQCEGIFVSVPSPANEDGSCDASILEDVLDNLSDYTGVIISKVTATPDIYERLQTHYSTLVYVPEFLTADNAIKDYQTENWAVIGGNILAYQREAERIIRYSKPDLKVTFCSIGEASLYKYIVNSFLATKVVFMNEMHNLAEHRGYNWNNIKGMMLYDSRIGPTHLQVPGPDGQYGFGGMCFPKDTSAILHYAKTLDCDLHILSNAVKKNSLLRLKKPK